ncbi:MAG: cell wall-binding repeat-containing protein, partial [Chloroflexia bacterium]|nr:cell wall-binding repeat-containing protein [Chloroflexia bacterium]
MIRFAATRRAVSILTALTLVLAFAAPAAAVDGEKYVALANVKRDSVGLAPVAMSNAVNTVSHERATQMANSDVMSHDLAYVASRLKALGVCFTGYGEIIAWERGYPTYDPARTMEQWWASQGHHDIIVGDFNAAGGSHKTAASNKIYSAMIFVKLCTAPSSSTVIQRLAGADRYSTAAAISRSRFGGGASTVFIATGASFPDALAGAPAAAKANGPILLTAKDGLPSATATELDRLNPRKIVILGGSAAVSSAVASRLSSYAGTVVRWWGADRYGTAAAVSKAAFAPGVAVAYVSTGSSFPDALSGGAIAGRNGGPILLVKQGALPGSTATELARLKPSKIVILGGTSAVSSAVADALRRYATSGSVTRLAGADRYATAVQVSRASYGSAGSDAVFVATGSNFPDGLAGGPVAALVPGPILLVNPTGLPSVVATELD